MADKLLELKGRYLNSAARKEDYRIEINGSRCPVLDVQQTFLICDLSNTVFKKDVPLLVSVSVGANWKTVLEHIKIFHISVMYLNNQEDRNMIGPQNETGNSPAQVTLRYDQIDSTPWVFVEEATQNPNPRFDAFEIADILKQHNIFIERDLVRLRQDIGQGNSVCVHKGYLSSMENRKKQLVAVKTVLQSGKQDINALLDEAMIMKDFDHPNVLSLLGISVAPGKFPLIIFPFLANGNLLSYIQRDDNVQSCKDLMTFGLDVAMGMEYLCSLKFVHRDLAARNCMVDDNLQIKVANFGLARDVYTQNVYSSDNKKTLPVKWMAPESLKNGIYSTQSDVWSFGVVVWELMARGSTPYCDINDFDMRNYLQSGERLKRTDFCPPQLYDLMLRCWESDPDDRPTFQEINQRITGLLEQRLNNVK
ncbi:HGFR [Mytilus edulis]|uniref:MET n=1 Tax=Mytilus edulis TaxID=6550 RepID=A0A8S3UTZ5_MYTED|nr:HGFR [Mytilus edulis]